MRTNAWENLIRPGEPPLVEVVLFVHFWTNASLATIYRQFSMLSEEDSARQYSISCSLDVDSYSRRQVIVAHSVSSCTTVTTVREVTALVVRSLRRSFQRYGGFQASGYLEYYQDPDIKLADLGEL